MAGFDSSISNDVAYHTNIFLGKAETIILSDDARLHMLHKPYSDDWNNCKRKLFSKYMNMPEE